MKVEIKDHITVYLVLCNCY